ncbi:MAG: tRNA lysidine(34) synthetase TilS [Candidatus Omnitrophota bacterium]|nr:tRNA lysidine(34) synthetase TilS [Candidatus Omnitrophota bacterium]
MKLTDKVLLTIKKYRLIDKNDSIVIALSGGPDSVCLLYLLNFFKKEFRLRLTCAHLDHMLRGKDSLRDLLFAQRLSEKLKIPFYYKQIDVKKIKVNASLEETARKARQDFLFKVAAKTKSSKIALGHTKDDQAETILMRLLRGAGLYGLSAILPKRKISKYILIRPVIEANKIEILRYLKTKKIPYRIDHTNKEDSYFRNRIRNRLIPELIKYNKNIVDILASTAQSISLDYEYIKNMAQNRLNRIITSRNSGPINLETKEFLKLHAALRRIALRLSIEKIKGDLRGIDYRHVYELEDLIENRKTGSIVDLPGGISVLKTAGLIKLYFRHKNLA